METQLKKSEKSQKVRWSQEGPLHEEGDSREEHSNMEEHGRQTAYTFSSGSNLKQSVLWFTLKTESNQNHNKISFHTH